MKRLVFCLIIFYSLVCISCYNKKTILTLTVPDSASRTLLNGMRQAFPEIDFKFKFYYGKNYTYFLNQSIRCEETSDLVFLTSIPENLQKEALLDLSGYEFIGNYRSDIIDNFDVDGHIYLLPGVISYRTMAYNKTLFEKYGWKEPSDFEELIKLCKRIRSESDLIPIGFGMGDFGAPFALLSTLAQVAYLTTPNGAYWEEQYFEGKASFAEGFSTAIDLLEELINANAFDISEMGNMGDSEAIKKFFATGKAAMFCVFDGQEQLAIADEDPTYNFELFPFFGPEGKQLIGLTANSNFGISKRLAEKRNKNKLDAALKVFEWLSTIEARRLMRTKQTEFSSLTTFYKKGVAPLYANFRDNNLDKRKAYKMYSNYEDVIVEIGNNIVSAMQRGNTSALKINIIRRADALHYAALTHSGTCYGSFKKALNEEETVRFAMKILVENKICDFAMATHTGGIKGVDNRYGVSGRVFPGELLTDDTSEVFIPATSNGEIVVIKLLGNEVKDLLENGKEITALDDDGEEYSVVWKYNYAGIDVKYSLKGSVKDILYNGEKLDDNRYYFVGFMKNDYPKKFQARAVLKKETFKSLYDWYMANFSPVLD